LNACSEKSFITISNNGSFEKLDYNIIGESCESDIEKGKWPNIPVIYNNNLGEFKVENGARVYEVFSKGVNPTNFTVDKIDVTYGSILDDPSGRYIYSYIRIN
jgi:hypothetical protein